MDNQIQNILKDLYELEPNLHKRERELVKIVHEIMSLKPDTKFDDAFRQQLRMRLMAQADRQETKPSLFDRLINAATMKKLNYAIGMVAVLAIIAASALYVKDQDGNNLSVFTPGVKITKAGEAAFGQLNNVQSSGGMGGGGGGNSALGSAAPQADASAKSSESLTIAPDGRGGSMPYVPTNYKYVYKGEALDLSLNKLEVLKKQKGNAASMQSMLSSLNLGLINLLSFGNAKLQNATFAQEGPEGYQITVDTLNGSISIYGGYQTIMSSEPGCARDGDKCMAPAPVKISDIWADEVLFGITNQFIQEHNISLEAYGAPEVRDEWRMQYELAADKANIYIPDIVTVVYPLKLEDKEVFDEGGNKTGLMIGVNVRTSKVTSVYDLSLQNYESSSYEAETNMERIMKLVAQGGMYGWSDPAAKKTVEIELGEPRIEYVKMWNYNNNLTEELLVPSLIFPVVQQPSQDPNFYYRKAVVIPLTKQILDRYANDGGPINILPVPVEGTFKAQ